MERSYLWSNAGVTGVTGVTYAVVMPMSGAERQARYRARWRAAKFAAVPSLAPAGSGATPDGGLGPAGQN